MRYPTSVSIVIPAHNEQDILRASVTDIVHRMGALLPDVRHVVYLCENGSADGTLAQALQLQTEYPDHVSVLQSEHADYGLAMRMGFLHAAEEAVFLFDMDYYDLDFLMEARQMLQSCDIVIGSKTHLGSRDNRPWLRRMATWGFVLLLKLLFGLRAGDTHGIKGFRREPVQALIGQVRLNQDLLDTELIIWAERAGLRIRELPVHVAEKRPSRSNLMRRIPRVLRSLFWLRWTLWREA